MLSSIKSGSPSGDRSGVVRAHSGDMQRHCACMFSGKSPVQVNQVSITEAFNMKNMEGKE